MLLPKTFNVLNPFIIKWMHEQLFQSSPVIAQIEPYTPMFWITRFISPNNQGYLKLLQSLRSGDCS